MNLQHYRRRKGYHGNGGAQKSNTGNSVNGDLSGQGIMPPPSTSVDPGTVGMVAGAVSTGLSALEIGKESYGNIEKPGMSFGNTAKLAGLGATLGSAIPGVGTLVGGGVGAVGGLALDLIGNRRNKRRYDQEVRKAKLFDWRDRLRQDYMSLDNTGVFYQRYGGSVKKYNGGGHQGAGDPPLNNTNHGTGIPGLNLRQPVPGAFDPRTVNTDDIGVVGPTATVTAQRSTKFQPGHRDSKAENIFELFDPTGISSWDDAIRAYRDGKFDSNDVIETIGAIPLFGGRYKAIHGLAASRKYVKKRQLGQLGVQIYDTTMDIKSDNNRKGGKVRSYRAGGQVVVEGGEIGIIANGDGTYSEVFRSEGASHEAGGQQMEVPDGTEIFSKNLTPRVIEAMETNDWVRIRSKLLPARDAELKAARAAGDPYSTGLTTAEATKARAGATIGDPPINPATAPTGPVLIMQKMLENPTLATTAWQMKQMNEANPAPKVKTYPPNRTNVSPSKKYGVKFKRMNTGGNAVDSTTPPDNELIGGINMTSSPVWDFSTNPTGSPASPPAGPFDDQPGPVTTGNPFARHRRTNIHDVATAVNLGNAIINTFKGGPPPIHLQRPTAHLVDLDTTPIDNAYTRALGAINTAQGNVAKATRSVGDIVHSSGMASAAILDAKNNATAQKVQLENQVDAQNAQILNRIEEIRAEIANRETTINAEQQFQDARIREEAVTSNLQGAFNNQIAKRQEEVTERNAAVNNMIQVEALKMAVENDAFNSDDYSTFRTTYLQNVQSAATKELGDVNDPSNPIYTDLMSSIDSDFESRYQAPEKLTGQLEQIEKQISDINADGSIEGADKLLSSLDEDKKKVQESIDNDRTAQRERFQQVMMADTARNRLAELVSERASDEVIQEAYRAEKGVPKSNMSGLLTMLNVQ